jgi:hypothetical protein
MSGQRLPIGIQTMAAPDLGLTARTAPAAWAERQGFPPVFRADTLPLPGYCRG